MTGDDAENLAAVSTELIIARARRIKPRREKVMEDAGRLIAELNTRGYSFARIGEIMDEPTSNLYRWAKPYLPADKDTSD